MPNPDGKLSILHILLAVKETSAPYNEHCLPWANSRHIAVCSYFKSDMPVPAAISLFEGDGSLMGFFRALRAALKAGTYDVIHVHSPHQGVLFLLASSWNRAYRAPTVMTVHDSYQNYKLRNKLLFLPVFAGFDRVVCCSKASLDSFPAVFKRLAGSRLTYSQNGPDIERIDRIAASHESPASPDPRFTSVAITRMAAVKNPSVLLESFALAADAQSRLIWIGEGTLRQSLMEKSAQMGLADRIEFTGLIPRETVFADLLEADLFISTSLGEGLPVSVLEAMACGCPVLLSDIPPHREIAESVDFIPLVATSDPAGFALEIGRFRAMSAEERKELGRKCRRLVEEQFSLEAMHARYAAIYAQVSGSAGVSAAKSLESAS